MTIKNLIGALNRKTVEALIEKVYSTPNADGALASKEDRVRAMLAAQLIDSDHKKINRQKIFDSLFPGATQSTQNDNLRFFRSRFAREAKAKLGIAFELVDDKQTNLNSDQRWLWFEGPDSTEMMVDEAIGDANYRDSKNYAPQRSIALNSDGKPKRKVKYFVSLAHADDDEVNRFLVLFKQNLKGAKNFEFVIWQDKMIQVGQNWREQIRQAIDECEFGLLLLSPSFFASDFIKRSELPNFIAPNGAIDGLKKAIPVCLKPVSWGVTDTYGVEAIQVFGVDPRPFSLCSGTPKKEQFCKELFEKLIPLLPVDIPEPPPSNTERTIESKKDNQSETMDTFASIAEHSIQNFNANKARATRLTTALDCYGGKGLGSTTNSEPDSSKPHYDSFAIDELLTWARDRNRAPYVAILAELGIGKTTNLKEFCNRLLRERRSNTTSPATSPIPIYLDLRLLVSIAKRSKTNHEALLMLNNSDKVVDWLLEQSFSGAGHPIKAKDVRELLKRDQAIVVFDSLDEILVQLGTAEAGTFVNTLYRFLPKDSATQRPMGKMIVACRTHYFPTVGAQNSTLLQQDRGEVRGDDFEALLLLPFDSSQIRTYLSNSLDIQDAARVDEIMALFASIHNLMDLSSRPLNLWLLKDQIPTLEKLKAQGRTIRAVDIYEMLVERWLLRDHEKHVMDEGLKPVLMQHLATALWASKQKSWTAAELDHWLIEFRQSNRSFNAQIVEHSIGSLKEDLRNSTFVTREGDSDLFRFAHNSMQEYFLAKALFSALRPAMVGVDSVWSGPILSNETFCFFGELLYASTDHERASQLDALRALADGGGVAIQSQILKYFRLAIKSRMPVPILAGLTFTDLDLQHYQLGLNYYEGETNLINLRNTTWKSVFANESHFSNVDFSGASFIDSKAIGACFEQCIFADCNYIESTFGGSDFRSCEYGFFESQKARQALFNSSTFQGALFYRTSTLDNSQAKHGKAIGAAPHFNRGHLDLVTTIALSPDGKRIVSGSRDKTIKVWDAQTGRCEQTLQGHQSGVLSLALSPDGKRIVSGSNDNSIKVWDAQTGRCEQTLQGHVDWVMSVALSPDGKRIVSGSNDNSIKVWDAQTGRCEQTLQGHQSGVLSVALSPDGKRIVSGSDDNSIKVWDAQTGRCEQTLQGHDRGVFSVALSPDGKRIVSGSDDNSIKVWDSQTGRCEQTLQGHQSWVLSVALSPDGKRLVVGGNGGISIFNNTKTDELYLVTSIYLAPNSVIAIDKVEHRFVELSGDAWRYARWHVPSAKPALGAQGRDDLWLPADAFD